MIEQEDYNLAQSIQKMLDFFEIMIENLGTPAPQPAVRFFFRKKGKRTPKKEKP